MALTESDLSKLLDALRAGEVTDTVRRSLEWILQQLSEGKPPVIGTAPHERTRHGRTTAAGIAPGCCRPPLVMSS